MAADIALRRLGRLPEGALVLDPMSGSGTVLRAASDRGLLAFGFDLDPLAVLMSRVWTKPIDADALRRASRRLLREARSLPEDVCLPWLDEDPETAEFANVWFAPRQRADLRRLAAALSRRRGAVGAALRLGLSRIIVTKLAGAGASLARDVSHSRPRRVLDDSEYKVFEGFERSVARLADRLAVAPPRGGVTVRLGDARCLSAVEDSCIDMVVTSPPYLNAIDYLRGHRLALVWLGHRVGELRAVRADSIGAERAPEAPESRLAEARALTSGLDGIDRLPSRVKGMLSRYALDLAALVREAARVLKPGGKATFVVGDSTLRGVFIENSALLKAAARCAGLRFLSQVRRPLEGKRRYLPPPERSARTNFDKRMSLEMIVTVVRE